MKPQQKDEAKTRLHSRNRNRNSYDLESMQETVPELKQYLLTGRANRLTIDFSDSKAVRCLNTAILKHYYGIDYWEFPKHNLCPPIPGRAEYIHHIADLLGSDLDGNIPRGEEVNCLDIGAGASCIYPIIGVIDYGWSFICSEVDDQSITSSQLIIENNEALKGKIVVKRQDHFRYMLKGILKKGQKIDISLCNPPFFKSKEEAMRSTRRKVRNLTGKIQQKPKRNFSGSQNELIYQGGDVRFIRNLIIESKDFGNQVLWFSVLVSKVSNLKRITDFLKSFRPKELRTMDFATGNKKSRILAWSFQSAKERREWWNAKEQKESSQI